MSHWKADQNFYRTLYRMTFNTDAPDVHDEMQAEGRALWQGLVRAAVGSGPGNAVVSERKPVDETTVFVGFDD